MNNLSLEVYDRYEYLHEKISEEENYKVKVTEQYTLPQGAIIHLPPDVNLEFEASEQGKHVILYSVGLNTTVSYLVMLTKRSSTLTVDVSSRSFEESKKVIAKVKKQFPPAPDPLDLEVTVKFWYLTKDGPRAVQRNIATPDWTQIKGNYARETQKGLDALMTDFKPVGGGKLILWHGVPGTGKTYALRSLVHQWKEWANVAYILDPEALFGESPGYLAQMVFSEDDLFDEDGNRAPEKWKILILEDTGELLADNARERSGQGLSRLLNLADGFIGQGLRVLIIITTNEEIGKLHPAVSREGRCAASINFAPLSATEAMDWAGDRGLSINAATRRNWTLADLYAIGKDDNKIEVVESVGSLGFRSI